jgi:glutaminase
MADHLVLERMKAAQQGPLDGCRGLKVGNVIQNLLEQLHEKYKELRDGEPASYIPELAKACPDDFGIAIATADGRCYEVGKTRHEFTIQSISKPFIYALGLKTLSPKLMKSKIDVEPSGEAFNALSLHPQTGKPRNPMINAGAIAASALLCNADPEGAEGKMLDYFANLAGRRLAIDTSVYLSEKQTGHRNRAIGHMLRNFDIIDVDPEPALDLYFRQCSISVNCRDLSIMASTLACQGRNPITGVSILTPEITVRVLALMGSCGMYDFAGQWLYDVGIPAKSGVAGGVIAVMPGRFGFAIYSPPLDSFGNSVRGIAVCKELSRGVGLSLFNEYPHSDSTIRRSYKGSKVSSRRWRTDDEVRILDPLRDSIRILHVQGVLDFGAIEQLAAELVRVGSVSSVLIIDFAHVTQCPSESYHLLLQQLELLLKCGVHIVLSRIRIMDQLRTGLADGFESIVIHDQLDRALEHAENFILAQQVEANVCDLQTTLDVGFLRHLTDEQRSVLAARMLIRHYDSNQYVIRRGEEGDELFLVRSGTFTTTIQHPAIDGTHLTTRLATFGPGMCFGELSFISGNFRSADVRCEEGGSCWILNRQDFDALKHTNPGVIIELLQALSLDIGRKLTSTSLQLTRIEQG